MHLDEVLIKVELGLAQGFISLNDCFALCIFIDTISQMTTAANYHV